MWNTPPHDNDNPTCLQIWRPRKWKVKASYKGGTEAIPTVVVSGPSRNSSFLKHTSSGNLQTSQSSSTMMCDETRTRRLCLRDCFSDNWLCTTPGTSVLHVASNSCFPCFHNPHNLCPYLGRLDAVISLSSRSSIDIVDNHHCPGLTLKSLTCHSGGEKPVYLVEKDSVAVTSTEKPFWRWVHSIYVPFTASSFTDCPCLIIALS